MMTREEAIMHLSLDWYVNRGCEFAIRPGRLDDFLTAIRLAAAALRRVSRERVEVEKVWRGEWIVQQGEHSGLIKKCSKCGFPISGWWGADKFCANCGASMTDEAVQILLKRLKALKDGSTTG